jgi:anti-sigma B factor antagonist
MDLAVNKFDHYDLITISGRIDSYTAPNIEKALKSLISGSPRNIVVNMENVTYISSSGILVFVNTQKFLIKKNQGRIIFSGTSDLVFSAFSLAGFNILFDFYSNTASAVESFRE